jgi:hypothetical protein
LGKAEPQPIIPPAAPPDYTSNKGGQQTVYVPAGKPITITNKNGQQTTIPASSTPQSLGIPKNGNGQVTVNTGNGQPYTIGTGNQSGDTTISIPGYRPITIHSNGSVDGTTPNPFNPTALVPTTLTPTSIDQTSDTPISQTLGLPTAQQTAATGIALVGITQALQGLNNKIDRINGNTSPDAIRGAAAKGTCDTLQPGGCMLPLANNAANAANNSKQAADNTAGILAGEAASTAAIMTELNGISRTVGVSEFPATMPASLVTAGGAAVEASTTIPNLARLHAWHIEQLDALFGAFELPITVAGKTLTIPNMAEGMAEQIGMQAAGIYNQELLLNLCTRTIAEVGQIKQQEYKTYMAVEAIIEYLSFKHKEVQQPMPMSFVPGETSLLDLLKEATQTVSVIQFDDSVTQRTFLLDLARAAAITRAQGFRQVNGTTAGEIQAEVLQNVQRFEDFSNKLAEEPTDAQGRDSTDQLISQIMNGYPEGQNPFACQGEEPPQINRVKGQP